ncbi:peptidoglycan-recognition protein LC [Xylocopa sonorina]|uniref:peptidoglycan-recognition protein LC n=1 Tax=Xylocopa sonorina TaxID=1818115 RepID=UPI00403AEC0B
MVTLVQQQQQPKLDEGKYQKEQDHGSNDSVENRDIGNSRSEVAHTTKSIQLPVHGNGSVTGSSTQCSDVDDVDDDEDETDIEEGEWIPDLPAVLQQQQVSTADGNAVPLNVDPTSFGDIRIKNSTNVHLGNKTFYNGPVAIKQFVYTTPTAIQGLTAVKNDNDQAREANTATEQSTANNSILTEDTCFSKVTKWLSTWRCGVLLCILALCFVVSVIVISIYLARNTVIQPVPIFPEIPDSSLGDVKIKNVRFVERDEWGAQPPAAPLTKMKLPVPYVIISHTVTDFCTTQSECTFRVRMAQTFHIESRKWSDIAYNFLVGGDGLIYVGRSWNYMGAHSFGFNNRSIGISFIGTFNTVVPPKRQLQAAQRIIELGVEGSKIAKDYKLLGHRQISPTLSPGDALFDTIKTWPHWSPKP